MFDYEHLFSHNSRKIAKAILNSRNISRSPALFLANSTKSVSMNQRFKRYKCFGNQNNTRYALPLQGTKRVMARDNKHLTCNSNISTWVYNLWVQQGGTSPILDCGTQPRQ